MVRHLWFMVHKAGERVQFRHKFETGSWPEAGNEREEAVHEEGAYSWSTSWVGRSFARWIKSLSVLTALQSAIGRDLIKSIDHHVADSRMGAAVTEVR
jgi:hypothetical protein